MKVKRLVFLALCMVIALTSSILPTALTIKASDSTESVLKYDYSNPDSTFNVTATAADVLEKLEKLTNDAGYELKERLAIYEKYINEKYIENPILLEKTKKAQEEINN